MRKIILAIMVLLTWVSLVFALSIGGGGDTKPITPSTDLTVKSLRIPQKATGQYFTLMEGLGGGGQYVTIKANDTLSSNHTILITDSGMMFDGSLIGSGSGCTYTTPPTYSDSTCSVNTCVYDASYVYLCGPANTWSRTARTTWNNPQSSPASIAMSPTSKDYGNVIVNNTSTSQTYTLTNSGGQSGSLGTFALSGTNSAMFTLSNNTCTGTLAAAASCTMGVTFTPTSEGAKSATLGDGTYSASLTGTGVTQATDETLTATAITPGWSKYGSATNLVTGTDTDDATYFYTSTTSASISATYPTPSGSGTITSVKMCARFMVPSSSTNTPQPQFKMYYNSTYQSFTPNPITTLSKNDTWTDVCTNNLTTNPYTSTGWVAADINPISWRTLSGTTGTMTLNCSKIWIVVNY